MSLETAYVGVGSNIEPEKKIIEALLLLVPEGLTRVSTVYRTEPVDSPGEPFFYNCVIELKTDRPPSELKYSVLRPIEESLGRRRGADRCAPRPIDLDLIAYGAFEGVFDGLSFPDKEIFTRAHMAVPLSELAPMLYLPGGLSPLEVARRLGTGGLERLDEYTRRVQEAVFG